MGHGAGHMGETTGTNWKEVKEIPLSKNVYGFKNTKRTLNRDIVEFLPKSSTIEELFDMYNSLFYEIDLRGKKSHNSIINKSSKYAGTPLDEQTLEIQNLQEQIQTLEEDIDSIEDEHPFIPNRSVIQNRANNKLNYYMQSGRKRQILDDRVLQIIKKQSGLNKQAPDLDFVILLDSTAIGGIISGPPINNINDLNIDILEINRFGQNLNNIIKIEDNQISPRN